MISLESDQIIRDLKIVNWQNNKDVINKMKLAISDMIYDEVKTMLPVLDQWWNTVYDYELDKVARIPTLEDIEQACNIIIITSGGTTSLTTCDFVYENTRFIKEIPSIIEDIYYMNIPSLIKYCNKSSNGNNYYHYYILSGVDDDDNINKIISIINEKVEESMNQVRKIEGNSKKILLYGAFNINKYMLDEDTNEDYFDKKNPCYKICFAPQFYEINDEFDCLNISKYLDRIFYQGIGFLRI